MENEGQVADNFEEMTPAARELFKDDIPPTEGAKEDSKPDLEGQESQGAESTKEEEEAGENEGTGQPDEGGESGLEFEEPEVPEDWSDDVKAAFQEQLEQVKKQWQAAYTRKRQAETSEIKEMRAKLEELTQAVQGGRGQQNGEENEPDDPLALELEALRQEDPEVAETTERLLRVTREATKQEVLGEVQKLLGPIMEQYNQLQLVNTMKQAEESLGLEEGFLDNNIDVLNERVQKAMNDPGYFMRLVALELAQEKQGGNGKAKKNTRTTSPAPSARSPKKSAPAKTGPIDWDAELAKIPPDDTDAIAELARRKAEYMRARR